jgi:hypothetical protein
MRFALCSYRFFNSIVQQVVYKIIRAMVSAPCAFCELKENVPFLILQCDIAFSSGVKNFNGFVLVRQLQSQIWVIYI